jgi:hypothetical protein
MFFNKFFHPSLLLLFSDTFCISQIYNIEIRHLQCCAFGMFIPDPGAKKGTGPRSGSATLIEEKKYVSIYNPNNCY